MDLKSKPLWYFAYGSNMSSAKFTGSRGIVPLDTRVVRIPGWVLRMDIPGMPYSEPSFSSVAPRQDTNAEEGIAPDVVGVAYLIRPDQYTRVIASEGGGIAYRDICIVGEPIGRSARDEIGSRIMLRTLGAAMVRHPPPAPSRRYMNLLIDGGKESHLPPRYQQYLAGFPVYKPPDSAYANLGASIFLAIWGPVMRAMENVTNKNIQEDGYAPCRGWSNVEAIMPKIQGAVNQRKTKNNTNIDLSTAENWLIRPELMDICKDSIAQNLEQRHFSYPRGFSGDPDLIDAYASLLNRYFSPHVPILPSHLSTAPGASGCIDALLYNICEAGDGVLLPGPYWNGFDFGIRVRSAVNPIIVPLPSLGANFCEDRLLPALEEAYASATCPVRAMMITNPHNPLAVCYPEAVLEQCLRFCKKHRIHFISDEVYALSRFPCPDLVNPTPFVSVLSLDLDKIGADKSRVHMGCAVTQFNENMAVGLALAANTQISALSTIFVTNLLTSPKLPSLITLNAERLSAAYSALTSFFKANGVPYIPCNAGLYVFAKLAPWAETWEDEASVVSALEDAGVLVSAGRAYHLPENEKGWMRVGFAVPSSELDEAIRRIQGALAKETRQHRENIVNTESNRPSTLEDGEDEGLANRVKGPELA
ncbi:hypothetical protein DL765_011330 [Monosporascus sp. GIB2]|nr:hypothetical protein DL765_011330 [Monosporascus sp. GIB2]